MLFFVVSPFSCSWTNKQGRRQVKIYRVDRHGEPITGVWRRSDPPPTPPPVKTRLICINFRSDLWQKWGGHVHPSSPRGDATANKIHMPQPVLRTNKWKINGKEGHDKLNTSRSSYSVIFSSVLSPVGSTVLPVSVYEWPPLPSLDSNGRFSAFP